MATKIKFNSDALRVCDKEIKRAYNENLKLAVNSINKASNNKNWKCKEKNKIQANLERTKSEINKAASKLIEFSNTCSKMAVDFENVENEFIRKEKTIVKKHNDAKLKSVVTSLKGVKAIFRRIAGNLLKTIGSVKISTPKINENPFSKK